jgi:alpha-tubulin suppressor-like RCC1 family protein
VAFPVSGANIIFCVTPAQKSLTYALGKLRLIFSPTAAVAAGGALALAGCASGPARSAPPLVPLTVAVTATPWVQHWGSFFGGFPGNFDVRYAPAALHLPGRVAQVGTSNSTEYALLSDGSVWSWGLGTQGQLGDGRLHNSFTRPVRVRFPAGVKIAWLPTDAMPYDTGLAVDTTGHAWGWGRNGGGELCRGTGQAYPAPVRVPLSHVTALAGASNHAIYDAAGQVVACGQSVAGDLGTGHRRNTTRPVQVAGLDGSRVRKLVASFANSGALMSDGRYYDWGYNADGQLGDGRAGRSSDVPVLVRLAHPVREVAQGGSLWHNGQTLVILSDGSTWSWGANLAGELGDGTTAARSRPVRFYAPPGVTYRTLATGSATSYAVATDGRVYAWGVSHVGQVGNGRWQTSFTPSLIATGAIGVSATANNVAISLRAEPPACAPGARVPARSGTSSRTGHQRHRHRSGHRPHRARDRAACPVIPG